MAAGLFPVLFIPTLTDAYVLPRAALAVIAACVLVGYGLASARPQLGSLGLPAVAVALTALLAAAFSVAPSLSIIGSYARYESAVTRLSYLGLFIGAAWLARTPTSREWTLTAFVGGCAVASLEALYEALVGFPQRPDGNLGQANLLGALLAMAIPIVVARALRRPAWGLLLVPLGAGLVLSSSRSGWLGALAGSVLVAALSARAGGLRIALVGAAVAAVLGALAVIVLSPLATLNGDSGAARLHVWRDALPVVAARPLLGYGEDTLGLVMGPHLTGNWEPGVTFDRIHQNELDLLATQGALGLAATTWLFGGWLVACWRRAWDRVGPVDVPLVATLGAWVAYLLFAQLNFDWVPATGPLWILAGSAWAGWIPQRQALGRPLWILALPALAGAALAFGILPLLADSRAAAGDPAGAARLDPLQPRYHRLLGERGLHGDLAAVARGRDELLLAAALGEYEATALIELGDVQVQLGNRAGALAAYREAVTVDPFNPAAVERLHQAGG